MIQLRYSKRRSTLFYYITRLLCLSPAAEGRNTLPKKKKKKKEKAYSTHSFALYCCDPSLRSDASRSFTSTGL